MTCLVGNEVIVNQLEDLSKMYLGSKDFIRAFAYKKAASSIRAYRHVVTSGKEGLQLPGIGNDIADHVEKILQSNRVKKQESLRRDERVKTLALFIGIFGVGDVKAKEWYDLGYRTLEDVAKNAILTHAQALGVKYHADLQQKIPRAEVEQIGEQVKAVLLNIGAGFQMEICGSYRRGKSECDDIEIVISHPDGRRLNGLLHQLVVELHEAGILTEDLGKRHFTERNAPSFERFIYQSLGLKGASTEKYMGLCKNDANGLHRRIDLLIVEPPDWPFSLLYFTGPDHFHRGMRLQAKKQGFVLSQYALRRTNGDYWSRDVKTEVEIFELLGLNYCMPEERETARVTKAKDVALPSKVRLADTWVPTSRNVSVKRSLDEVIVLDDDEDMQPPSKRPAFVL